MTRVRRSLAGRLVVGLDDALAGAASGELDPCPVESADGPVDIGVSRLAEIAPPPAAERAGDGGDGWISAVAADRLYLMRQSGGACVVEGCPGELPLRVDADAALPPWALMRTVVRPLLQLGLPARGALTVHAAAVARDGAGVLVAGWSESGKTEVALALAERGWDLVADKWTVLGDDGRMAPFPVSVGIRSWALEHLPRLRSSLPARARWRMAVADRASDAVQRAAGHGRSPLAGAALDALRRSCAQGERLSMSLTDVRAAYGAVARQPQRPPLTAVVILRTVTSGLPVGREISAEAALRRLSESAAYERRDGLGLLLRRRFGGSEDALGSAVARERELLAAALRDVPLIEVCCPFPSDPRLVAELLEDRL